MDQNRIIWLEDNIINPVESGFVAVGIDTAWKAGLVVSLITAGILLYSKPSSMFDPRSGIAKSWIYTRTNDPPENQTYVPWWLAAGIAGYAVNLIA